jgi:hypothetical protein
MKRSTLPLRMFLLGVAASVVATYVVRLLDRAHVWSLLASSVQWLVEPPTLRVVVGLIVPGLVLPHLARAALVGVDSVFSALLRVADFLFFRLSRTSSVNTAGSACATRRERPLSRLLVDDLLVGQ